MQKLIAILDRNVLIFFFTNNCLIGITHKESSVETGSNSSAFAVLGITTPEFLIGQVRY
jgi:hypothetical protein